MIRILFMGRKPVAAQILRQLQEDPRCEVVGVLTDSHLADSITTETARSLGIEVLDYAEVGRQVDNGDLRFDLGFSVLYWRKLKHSLINAMRYGIINFHPAPLPNYKGVGGYNLAILEEQDTWAVTAHYVDEQIDTGRIIALERFNIDPSSETAQSLERSSMSHLLVLFERIWARLADRPRVLPSSPNVGGRYLSRGELEAMKRIDVENDDVDRKVRAFWFPPYDGAYMEFGGERFTLINRDILRDLSPSGVSSLFSRAAAAGD